MPDTMPDWEIGLALDTLGLSEADKQTVEAAIPTAAKLMDHINDNKALFATLWADIQLILPAAKIVLDAVAQKSGGNS